MFNQYMAGGVLLVVTLRDESYGDVETSGNNVRGRIVRGRNVQGRIVPVPGE